MRIGHGFDVHRLASGCPLVIGGVRISYDKGLAGHSDGDVLLHAVTDAILGAAALGDLGQVFGTAEPEYQGADSCIFLEKAYQLVQAEQYTIANVDATVICEAPKLVPYRDEMRQVIADTLQVSLKQVSVKATTTDGLGYLGAGEGIAAHAVVLLAPSSA